MARVKACRFLTPAMVKGLKKIAAEGGISERDIHKGKLKKRGGINLRVAERLEKCGLIRGEVIQDRWWQKARRTPGLWRQAGWVSGKAFRFFLTARGAKTLTAMDRREAYATIPKSLRG